MLDSQLEFRTPHFQGTLTLLFQLVKKESVDILEICLHPFAHQLQEQLLAINPLEEGGENLLLLSHLLLIKSRKLLPIESKDEESVEPQVWDKLLDEFASLAVFKEMASELNTLEKNQHFFFERNFSLPVERKPNPIQGVELEALVSLFQQILSKLPPTPQIIAEEEWRFSSKIEELRHLLPLSFMELFSQEKGKISLILFFLALLELIKLGEVILEKRGEDVMIKRKEYE